MPRLISAATRARCASPTLYAEFIAGYAGVMMGMRCARSWGFTFGFQTTCSAACATAAACRVPGEAATSSSAPKVGLSARM
eukprot:2962561-Prorocentrum_lima.AAC.1